MKEVAVTPRSTAHLQSVLPQHECRRLEDALARLRRTLADRALWHVNSTSTSGGVAELLAATIPYCLAAGIDVHWLVIDADAEFFEVTKRLHNRLHESEGDGGELGNHERLVYENAVARERPAIEARVRPRDVVVLHDPQTAALARGLATKGAVVIWRCHIGVDEPGPLAREGWEFLRIDVDAAHLCIFSRPQYAWDRLTTETTVLAPCIDVLSPKNRPLTETERDSILASSGVVPTPQSHVRSIRATRPIRATRRATAHELEPVPADRPLVVQVSRWDRLKDPLGLVRAFAADPDTTRVDAHLVVAGPRIQAVDDDPEDAEVFGELRDAWMAMPVGARRRIHLACLPIDDLVENALIVNALQSRADVVAQKSLAEGFGLTVTEAMWKGRAVVAGRVGGIQDQIVDGVSGLLVDEPCDDEAFGRAIGGLLCDTARARRLGDAARERVCERFSPVRYHEREAQVLAALLA
jgi:trehalose synthase